MSRREDDRTAKCVSRWFSETGLSSSWRCSLAAMSRGVTRLTGWIAPKDLSWTLIEVFCMETQVKMYHFFVGGTRHETDKPFLTGAEIKSLAAVNPEYQLFYRDDVNTPDREVRDTQAVDLISQKEEDGTADRSVEDNEALALDEVHKYHGHFYAVPNSSYKRLKSNP